MLVGISTLILLLIAVGWKYHRNRRVHIACMLTAFVSDLLLVLYIEWTRHAIDTVTQELTRPVHDGLLLFHVGVSLLSVLLYLAQIATGFKLFKGQENLRLTHHRLAYAFIACRLTNYVTSFWFA